MQPQTTAAPTVPTPTSSAPTAATEKLSPEDAQRERHTAEQEAKGSLTLDEALKLFDDAKKYVDSGLRTKWDNYFKVYKGQRVIRNYEGISDPVIRESHTIIETLVANIAGGAPKFHFVKTTEEQTDDTEVLNGMLDFYMVYNQMGLKNQEWVRDMLLYGTGILHVSWVDGKPFIENIPLRDFFVDPTATGMVQTINPARYAGYQYLADKRVLERQLIFDPEADPSQNVSEGSDGDADSDSVIRDGEEKPKKGAWVKRYKNLDTIGYDKENKNGATQGDNAAMDKAFKDLFNGSTLGDQASDQQIHVIRIYDLLTGRVFEIGNRKDFIYDEPTWCQREEMSEDIDVEVDGEIITTKRTLDEIKPFLPFAVLRDYVDTSQFYGDGEMAVLFGDNELLNDYESMDIDNNAYQNTPMYWVDPQFADLAPEIETIPGAVYPIPRNAMGALERPQLSGDLDAKKERIQQRMRRATAADEAVQGVSQQKGRQTATEVQSQLNQANTRFSTKINNLESEGYAQLGIIIFKFVQIFVTKRTAVRIVGTMGTHFKDYDPWEFNGEWEAHVELDTTIKQKEMQVQARDEQTNAMLLQSPIFNPVEVHRYVMQKRDPTLTDEKFNSLLAPPSKPKDDTQDFVNVSYKDLEPYARFQWQKNVGWEPDPSLLGDMQNRMLEQANQGADHLDAATRADGSVVPGLEPPKPTAATPPEGMPK